MPGKPALGHPERRPDPARGGGGGRLPAGQGQSPMYDLWSVHDLVGGLLAPGPSSPPGSPAS